MSEEGMPRSVVRAISNATLLQQKNGAYFVIDVGGVGVGVYDVLKRRSATAVYSYTANAKAYRTSSPFFLLNECPVINPLRRSIDS